MKREDGRESRERKMSLEKKGESDFKQISRIIARRKNETGPEICMSIR